MHLHPMKKMPEWSLDTVRSLPLESFPRSPESKKVGMSLGGSGHACCLRHFDQILPETLVDNITFNEVLLLLFLPTRTAYIEGWGFPLRNVQSTMLQLQPCHLVARRRIPVRDRPCLLPVGRKPTHLMDAFVVPFETTSNRVSNRGDEPSPREDRREAPDAKRVERVLLPVDDPSLRPWEY